MPTFCKTCSRLNFTVSAPEYYYDSIVHCSPKPDHFSLTIGGQCENKDEPGNCLENIAPWHHQMKMLFVPNMIFNHSRAITNDDGISEPEWFMSYACVADIMGHAFFSFFLNSRDPNMSAEWIREKMEWANQSGLLDMSGSVISDKGTWEACGISSVE
jgi:hypothetical protein